MKKLFVFSISFIMLMFALSVIIGKSTIKHIDYEQYINNVKYFSMPIDYVHKEFKQSKELFIDDNEINNIEDLISKSEYVLRIKTISNPDFYGNGIINNVKILEVFKGNNDENIKVGKEIKIYDLVSFWESDYVNYYGGITPLNSENEYIVFLNKATLANKKNTYIFSSIRYGHFNVTVTDANVLINYIQGSLTIREIMKFDYVETNCESSGYNTCDKYVEDYSLMKEQLLNYINN